MFYSITGTALFKLGCFLKVASDANWANAIMINLIMGLDGLAAVYAVKNALNLIAHRNDEARKQALLDTITENERNNWGSLALFKKRIIFTAIFTKSI